MTIVYGIAVGIVTTAALVAVLIFVVAIALRIMGDI